MDHYKNGSGNEHYDDGACETESQCYMCNFKQYPKATLRGLCDNIIIDVFYNILWDEDTNLPYYRYRYLLPTVATILLNYFHFQ